MRHRVRRATSVPTDLRPRLEAARLETLALLRALDHAHVPPAALHPQLNALFQLDADCAEALWALDQPAGTLDLALMVRDTMASLQALPAARKHVRARLPKQAIGTLHNLESAIRAALDLREAYNDVLSRNPQNR